MTPATSAPPHTATPGPCDLAPAGRREIIQREGARFDACRARGRRDLALAAARNAARRLGDEGAHRRLDALDERTWELLARVDGAQGLMARAGTRLHMCALEIALASDPEDAVARLGAMTGFWPGHRWQPRTQPHPGRLGILIQGARSEIAAGRRHVRFQLDRAGVRGLYEMCAGTPAWRRPRLVEVDWLDGPYPEALICELQVTGPSGPAVIEGITPLDHGMRPRITSRDDEDADARIQGSDCGGWRVEYIRHFDEDIARADIDGGGRTAIDDLFPPLWTTCDHAGAAWMGWGDFAALGCSRCHEALIHPVPRHALPRGHRRRAYLDAPGQEGADARRVYALRHRARHLLLTGSDPGLTFAGFSADAAGHMSAEPTDYAGEAPRRSAPGLSR